MASLQQRNPRQVPFWMGASNISRWSCQCGAFDWNLTLLWLFATVVWKFENSGLGTMEEFRTRVKMIVGGCSSRGSGGVEEDKIFRESAIQIHSAFGDWDHSRLPLRAILPGRTIVDVPPGYPSRSVRRMGTAHIFAEGDGCAFLTGSTLSVATSHLALRYP
jgi:hypothetical protein